MLREGLTLFMAGLNTSAYLGQSEWRLPAAAPDGPGCAVNTGDPGFVYASGMGCSGPEVGEFNQFLNSTYGSIDDSPFLNLATNNGESEHFGHWLSSEGPSGRNYFAFGGEGDLGFCGVGRCDGRYVWLVHDGDIGTNISSSLVESECIDADGDGWGWDGVTSCRVEVVEAECVDSPPVGDGWGWDGTSSCRIDGVSECLDTPPANDGWGWDGASSCSIDVSNSDCVDTPPVRDGWGWNGVTSCRI